MWVNSTKEDLDSSRMTALNLRYLEGASFVFLGKGVIQVKVKLRWSRMHAGILVCVA